MKFWIVSLFLLVSCVFLLGDTKSEQFYLYAGVPKAENHLNQPLILENRGYLSGYDEQKGVPAWVAYRVFRVENYETSPRPSRFLVDIRTSNRIIHDHYTNSGYDRGHMAPNFAIATRYGAEAQRETFLMTNIIPQKPNLNRRAWKKLEGLIAKEYSELFGDVWVITGPVFIDETDWLHELVQIPSHCYMILKTEHEGGLKMKAFLMPQDVKGSEPLEKFLISVRDIELKTGLNFNPDLDDELENALETAIPEKMWHE